jgi:two-component system, OmpR family, KDP operon response regulator KdpE
MSAAAMTTTAGTGPRILHVEDEEVNRALVRAVLDVTREPALRTVELVEATSLSQARALAASAPPHVVLLDVLLPDGTGLELARELRHAPGPGPAGSSGSSGSAGSSARPSGSRPRVIALTAGVLPEQQAAAMEAGCDAFLRKPFTAEQLVRALLTQLRAG